MRGEDTRPASLFSYVHLEDRIPADHPLRVIRTLIDPMLAALSPRFGAGSRSGARQIFWAGRVFQSFRIRPHGVPYGDSAVVEVVVL